VKKLWCFLLAVVMVVGLAGCRSDAEGEANPVGDWTLYYDWAYDTQGTYAVKLHIKEGGQFNADYSSPQFGAWSMKGEAITLKWNGGAVYTGIMVTGSEMNGTMIDSNGKGKWSAERIYNH